MNPAVLEAEQVLLGAAIQNRSAAAHVTRRLSADDFGHAPHRLVFTALAAMTGNDRSGASALLQQMASDGDLESIGGASAIHDLVAACTVPSSANVEAKAEVVVRAARRRRIHEAGQRISQAAADPSVDDGDLAGLTVDALLEAHVGYESQAGIFHIRDLDLDSLYDGKVPPEGLETGWSNLDRFYKPAPGWWTLVHGIPSHGKSSWLDALVVQLAEKHGWRFAICSPENLPLEEHASRLVQLKANAPFYEGPKPRMSRELFDESKRWVDEHFTMILPDENGRTLDAVLSLSRLHHELSPIDGLVVDPWNELDHSRPSNLREDEYISQQLTRLRAFARQQRVHVWLVAHPTKLQKGKDGTYPVPTPYDVSGAAHWRNKADNCVAVWRDIGRPDEGTQVHVQKVRRQPWHGTEGMVRLMFQKGTGRFVEMVDVPDDRRFV